MSDTAGFLLAAYVMTTFLPPMIDDEVSGGEYALWVAAMTVVWAFATGVTAAVMAL